MEFQTRLEVGDIDWILAQSAIKIQTAIKILAGRERLPIWDGKTLVTGLGKLGFHLGKEDATEKQRMSEERRLIGYQIKNAKNRETLMTELATTITDRVGLVRLTDLAQMVVSDELRATTEKTRKDQWEKIATPTKVAIANDAKQGHTLNSEILIWFLRGYIEPTCLKGIPDTEAMRQELAQTLSKARISEEGNSWHVASATHLTAQVQIALGAEKFAAWEQWAETEVPWYKDLKKLYQTR